MEQVDNFVRFMEEKRLNITQQRLRIAELFFSSQGHFTLEEIYQKLRQVDPDIGQTTLYRTLKLLCEAELAEELDLGEGTIRYEAAAPHHHHALCVKCGRIVEFFEPRMEQLQTEVSENLGFSAASHVHYLSGHCAHCRK